jgi:hypothetical protein
MKGAPSWSGEPPPFYPFTRASEPQTLVVLKCQAVQGKKMKNRTIGIVPSLVLILVSATIVANVDGGRMEMRGAWVSKGR